MVSRIIGESGHITTIISCANVPVLQLWTEPKAEGGDEGSLEKQMNKDYASKTVWTVWIRGVLGYFAPWEMAEGILDMWQ